MEKVFRNVKSKLMSSTGASILIALILFLVAAMVSAVIVSAAYTAFKSVHYETENEQDYLSVSSAARLVGEGLANTECSITEKETRDKGVTTKIETTYKCEGTFGVYLTDALKDPLSSQHTMTLTLGSLSGDAADAISTSPFEFKFTFTPVNVENPSENYKITGYVQSDQFKQKVWVTAKAVPSGDDPYTHEETLESNHDIKTYTTVRKYCWSDVRLNATGGTND